MATNPKIIVIPKPAIRVITGARVQGTGVRTVTGNLVDNTDPENPIIDQSVSTDAGNDSILGTDGLLFTPERVQSVTGNLVNNTDPLNPVVDAAVSSDANNDTILGTDNLPFTPQRVQSVTGDTVDNTDPLNPIVKSTANLTFYATNVPSGVSTYTKLVTNITDPDYNTVPVNVPTGAISGTAQVVANLVSGPGVFIGNPGTITINTISDVRRTSGTGVAEFYYEVYLRNSLGVETLIGTSNNTPPISQSAYTETQASMLFNNGVWTSADRLVIKLRANRIPGGSNPQYDFLFGGSNPFRTLFPVAASVIGDLPIAIGVTTVDGGTNGQVLRVTSGKVGQSELKTINTNSIFGTGDISITASSIGALTAVSVDGITITGNGTPGNPLVGAPSVDDLQITLISQVFS